MTANPLRLTLELTRTEDADDPHAFRFERQSYTLRTAGGGRELVEVPWGGRFDADLAAVRLPGRDPALVARVGESLRKILQPAGWMAIGREILGAVEAGRRVHLTLRANAAELNAIPWALTTLSRGGPHLGALPGVLLRYAWPETRTARPTVRPRPAGGRVLFAWSAAGGRVPASAHQSAIAAACVAGHVDFDPTRDVIPHASVEALVAALDAGPPVAILHLLAHGAEAGSTYGLALNGPDGASVIDAGHLRRQLAPFAPQVRLITVAACDGGNAGAFGNSLGSVGQALHRAGFASVIASRFPLSVAGSITLTRVFYRTLLEGPSSVETAVLAARDALAAEPTHLDWASVQLQARPEDGDDTRAIVFRPYRGLLAFQPEHARFLFGRDAERAETLGDLAALTAAGAPRFLVVAGASGTGKSSMVLAGAVPDLIRSGGDERPPAEDELTRAIHLLHRLPDDRNSPMVRQARTLLAAAARLDSVTDWQATIIRPGTDPQAALAPVLAQLTPESREVLLVVDQFEEVFTQTTDAAAREAFARSLWGLARTPESGVSVIITIRVDFLGRCGELILDESGLRLDRVAYDEAHRVFVAQMRPSQLRAAIEGPANTVGLILEAGLADRMLADVEGEPGALPLLSYTLDLLWQQRDGRTLTQQAYDALGGVSGALHGKADALVNALDEASRLQARRLLVRLVGISADGASDTRRRVAIAQLRPGREPQATAFDTVLDLLVAARLLVRAESDGDPTVEVAHEALIRRWPRLREWIQADHEMLSQVAEVEAWVAHWRRYDTLLQDEQLGYAQRIQTKFPDDLSEAAIELIAASEAELEGRTRRARRRLVAFAMAAGVIAIVMGALGLWGWSSSRKASDQARAADQAREAASASERAAHQQARAVRSALITTNASKLAEVDPLSATLVLTELLEPGLIEHAPTAAKGVALSLSSAALPLSEIRLSTSAARGLTITEAGDVMVLGDTLRCFSARGEPIECPAICPKMVAPVHLSGAGEARLLQDEALRTCLLNRDERPRDLGAIHHLALSRNGRFLALTRADGTLTRLDLRTNQSQPIATDGSPSALAIADTGLLAVLDEQVLMFVPVSGTPARIRLPAIEVGEVLAPTHLALDPATALRDGRPDRPVAWSMRDGSAWRLTPDTPKPAPLSGASVVGGPAGIVVRRTSTDLLLGAGDTPTRHSMPGSPVVTIPEGLYCETLPSSGAFDCAGETFLVHDGRLEALQPRFGRERVVAVAEAGPWRALLFTDGAITTTRRAPSSAADGFDPMFAGLARRGAILYEWNQDRTALRARPAGGLGEPRIFTNALDVDPARGQVLHGRGELKVSALDGSATMTLTGTEKWSAARFGPRGETLLAELEGGAFEVRRLPGGELIPLGGLTAVRVYPGPRPVVVDARDRVHLVDGAPRLLAGVRGVREVQWSPAGDVVAIADGEAGLWVVAGTEPRVRPVEVVGEAARIFGLRFSPDGAVLGWLVRTVTQADDAAAKVVMLPDGTIVGGDGSPIDPGHGADADPGAHPDAAFDGPGDLEASEDGGPFAHDPMGRPQGWAQVVELSGGPLKARRIPAGMATDLVFVVKDQEDTFDSGEADAPWLLTVNTANLTPSSKPRLVHTLDPSRIIEFPDLPKGLLYAAAERGLLVTRSPDAIQLTEVFGAGRLAQLFHDCPATGIEIGADLRTIVARGDGCPPLVLSLDLKANLTALRAKTTACLSREQRQRLLGEDSNDASALSSACRAKQMAR